MNTTGRSGHASATASNRTSSKWPTFVESDVILQLSQWHYWCYVLPLWDVCVSSLCTCVVRYLLPVESTRQNDSWMTVCSPQELPTWRACVQWLQRLPLCCKLVKEMMRILCRETTAPSTSSGCRRSNGLCFSVKWKLLLSDLLLSESLSESFHSAIHWVQIKNVTSLFGLSLVLVQSLVSAKD